MRRRFAAGTVLPLVLGLSLGLSGCGGDDKATKASGTGSSDSAAPIPTASLPPGLPTGLASCLSDLPSDLSSGLPSSLPTDLASCLPSNLPTDLPTDVPTSGATQASGANLDGCQVVTPALVQTDFGASAGQSTEEDASLGDPNAKDCYFFGGDATIVVQATTRADQDMPEASYSYEGLPGAQKVPGADRGWAYTLSDSGGSVTSALILVKGQNGLDVTVSISGHPYTMDDLQKFAADLLAEL